MSHLKYDVCIIGAGASGLVAAIESSRRGLSCVVVEKNKKAAAKLYATGNGRCNITNDSWDDEVYYGNPFPFAVYEHIYSLTNMRPRNFILDYFRKLGISTVNKDGYYYPESMQASSVVWALLDTAKGYGTEFRYNFEIADVDTEEIDGITYYSVQRVLKESENTLGSEIIYARNLIIAVGGLSQIKQDISYNNPEVFLTDCIGLDINRFRPGLCPVMVKEDLSSISGVRVKARLSIDDKLYSDSPISELGELQINDQGISGIVTFNMSYFMESGSRVRINVLPKISTDEFVNNFNNIRNQLPDKPLLLFLNGYINDKLAGYFINKFYGEMGHNLKIRDITETGIRELYDEMTTWTLSVDMKYGFDMSQASIGGIPTTDIDCDTMRIISDDPVYNRVYVVGEATDVIGKCGGYNLTYAFITGYLAGRDVK